MKIIRPSGEIITEVICVSFNGKYRINLNMKIVHDMNMKLTNMISGEEYEDKTLYITHNIINKRLQVQNNNPERFIICMVSIKYNGIKHISSFAYNNADVDYMKKYNITSDHIIQQMLDVILESTTIQRDTIIDIKGYKELVEEFDKHIKKLNKK